MTNPKLSLKTFTKFQLVTQQTAKVLGGRDPEHVTDNAPCPGAGR